MSIRQRLVMLLLVAAATLVALGGTALLQFRHNNQVMRSLTDTAIPGFLAATELASSLKRSERFVQRPSGLLESSLG